jgi:hypothetical protein
MDRSGSLAFPASSFALTDRRTPNRGGSGLLGSCVRGLPVDARRSIARSPAPLVDFAPRRSTRSDLAVRAAGPEGPSTVLAASPGIRRYVPSIDTLPGPGHAGVSTDEVPNRQVRDRCRPRGFAPPRRFAVPGSRGLVASRCRSWGSPRFVRCRATGRAGHRAVRSPRDAFRTPRRIPSPTAAPRHRGRCLSCGSPTSGRTPLLAQLDRTESPRRQMGSGPPIARRTSTHLRRSTGSGLTRCRRAPGRRASARSKTTSVAGCRADRLSGRFRALLRRRVRACSAPDWIPETEDTVLPGLRSPSRSSGLRSAAPSLHAVRGMSRTSGRLAQGAEDRR